MHAFEQLVEADEDGGIWAAARTRFVAFDERRE
jgi:hypothetical protein